MFLYTVAMTLAFTRAMSPETPYLMAAVLGGRRRPRQPNSCRWLKLADRLAAGMSPAAAALPERVSAAHVEGLLACADFRALVDAAREQQELPAEVQRRNLILLARQSLERALAFDDTAHAAIFVLEQEAHGRDPAVTLADGVLKTRARHQRPPPDPPPAPRRPAATAGTRCAP